MFQLHIWSLYRASSLCICIYVDLKSQTRGLLAEWYLKLSKFLPQLELKYKPGCQNKTADAVSRAPVENWDVCTVAKSDVEDKVMIS